MNWRSAAPPSSSRCKSQGKLDDALRGQILAADSKARLEDIYLPYKPKRRTKAQIAREAGLEPLADGLLGNPDTDPQAAAAVFVDADKGVADVQAALDGARSILVERFGEDADLIGTLRERMWGHGRLVAKVRDGKQEAGSKFADYFDFSEPFTKLPSHRILAMFRGEKEEMLELTLEPARLRRAAARPVRLRGDDRREVRHRRPGPRRPTSGSATPSAGRGAPASSSTWASTCVPGCARRPRTRPCGCSPPTCVTCCSPRPPAPAPPWASTPACARG